MNSIDLNHKLVSHIQSDRFNDARNQEALVQLKQKTPKPSFVFFQNFSFRFLRHKVATQS